MQTNNQNINILAYNNLLSQLRKLNKKEALEKRIVELNNNIKECEEILARIDNLDRENYVKSIDCANMMFKHMHANKIMLNKCKIELAKLEIEESEDIINE